MEGHVSYLQNDVLSRNGRGRVGGGLPPWWTRQREEIVGTDMHVHHLAITFHAIDDRCDEHKSVLARKVADAALILVIVAGMGRKVEFEGRGKSREGSQQDDETGEVDPRHSGGNARFCLSYSAI